MVRGIPAVLAVCALAGCGCGSGSNTTTVPVSTLTKAVRDTQRAGTFTFTIGGSFNVAGQGFPIQGEGAVDARAGRARASLDLTRALAASGVGSITPDEARADAVAIGRVVYVRSPYLVRRRGLRRPWIRYSLRRAVRLVGPVTRVGPDTIDGVKTTHYSAHVRLEGSATRLTGASLPVDVWVDAADRIRRVQTQLATAQFQALPQLDIAGFGRPVTIRTPSPTQVGPPR